MGWQSCVATVTRRSRLVEVCCIQRALPQAASRGDSDGCLYPTIQPVGRQSQVNQHVTVVVLLLSGAVQNHHHGLVLPGAVVSM